MNKHNTYDLAPGLTISRIVTGLWQIADMERDGTMLDPDVTSQFMEPYVATGLTTFDMADHYGSSEVITGRFKNKNPLGSKVQLLTKWVPEPGPLDKKTVREAIEKALERMQQKQIDLMQFHAWHYADPSWLDGLFFLKELKNEGLIKQIGVTNFDAAHLRIALASGIPIVSNQVCHSLIDQRANGNMAKVCSEYEVKLLAFGTLAGGFLTEKWLDKKEPLPDELKTWSEMKYKRFIDAAGGWQPYQNLLKIIKKISDKHKVSMANIATAFMLESKSVAAIIIGARLGESEHINDNKKILDITFDNEDVNAIRSAQKELLPIPGDCGDEYRKPPFLTASGDLSHHLTTIPKPFQPIKKSKNREKVYSGTVWEKFAGYSRAVKIGNQIYVSGTTATLGSAQIGGKDPSAQAHFVIDKIEGAIESLGGSLSNVVRTRIYVNTLEDWEAVAEAHGERFRGIDPANTLVEAKLVGEGYLVEIEADAVLS